MNRLKRIFILGLALLASMPAFAAVDDDLEEATPLAMPEVRAVSPGKATANAGSRLKARKYFLTEGTLQKDHARGQATGPWRGYVPNAELSATIVYPDGESLQGFFDAVGRFDRKDETFDYFLNQIGARARPAENVQLEAGKIRSRRTPGMIVSPSDFLHTSEALPGLRESRAGVWVARAGFHSINTTADIGFAPWLTHTPFGWPRTETDSRLVVARYFQQYGAWDWGLQAGWLTHPVRKSARAGAHLQTVVAKALKIYAETGRVEDRSQHLLGTSFEGFSDVTLKLEYFHNGVEAVRNALQFQPFLRRRYVMGSVAINDLISNVLRDVNWTVSMIKSTEETSWVSVNRLEWGLADSHVLGLTHLWVAGNSDSAYSVRPIDHQLSADWKWSF